MPEKFDTRVSQSLDPETYRSVEGYGDDTCMFVDDVIAAFGDAHSTVGKVHDARERAEANPTWTPEARILAVSKVADEHKDRVLTRLARAERDLRARIAHTKGELSRPLTERAGLGNLNGEVRAHVKSLTRSEREKFLREAMEQDDGPTLEAVLGGQPFLSGLTRIDHEHYVRAYHVKRNPHLIRRLDLMKGFLDHIERNGPIIHTQFEKAVGAKPSVARAIKKLDQQARDALNIQPAA